MTEVSPSLQLPPQPMYSISTAFHAGFTLDNQQPDIVLVSSDRVLFYAHLFHLSYTSQNGFNGLLRTEGTGGEMGSIPAIVSVPEDSTLFNVVIHAIYNMSCSQYNPSLDTLLAAIPILQNYGIPLQRFVVSSTPLFDQILVQIPRKPMEVFLVADQNPAQARERVGYSDGPAGAESL